MKFRKSRKTKGGSSTAQKKHEPFLRPKEGNESSFLRPQARILAGENPLPETVQARMEQTLGEDFSSVKINQQSSEAAQMGALAYTNGENVHFAPGMYNPHTASGQELIGHELTHVKQQRQGRVQPGIQAKGLSLNNDRALEAEADHFGKKAATSSSELYIPRSGLEKAVTSKRASSGIVQMMPNTDYGEFKTPVYKDVSNYGVDIELEFHPNAKVDAKKIGLTQTVKGQAEGNNDIFSPTRANRQTGDGTYIDQLDSFRNPLYATGKTGIKGKLASTPTHSSWGQHATKQKNGTWNPAILKDTPTMSGRGNNSHQKFETAALALSGTQKDMYYGSVSWGWEVDNSGVFNRLPVTLATSGDIPTAGFNEAAKKWNDATSIGTIKTKGNPTQVYSPTTYSNKLTLPEGTKVKLSNSETKSGTSYNEIRTVKAPIETGLVKSSDLVDIGNGPKTIDLPISWSGTVDTTKFETLRKGKSKMSAALADLPNATKLTVINEKNGWLKVHLDPTQNGVVITPLGTKSIDAAALLRGYISKESVKP
ncbi:MAG: DUF4157 domain-containing protein [Fluviicola sp.]|nr:DUF4157 domain-containing protein [Fluviicola sp.]